MWGYSELYLSMRVTNALGFVLGRVMCKDYQVVVAGSADPDLVNQIMGLIARYCEANGITPWPIELRDTLLAVAALSHLESGKLDGAAIATCREDFADAARESFRDVTGVLAMPIINSQAATDLRH
jgi:hypothetical protein